MTSIPAKPPRAGRPVLVAAVLATGLMSTGAAADPVIELTQTGCQFVEPEGTDHQYRTGRPDDCKAINHASGAERVAAANVLELQPGRYVFRVTNANVPYEVGFWLREADYNWSNPVHKLTKISVSGGGLTTGTTLDY
ncbi:MAG: hypothetical protein ACFCUO_02740, partial [Rhodospirillales bacterium]